MEDDGQGRVGEAGGGVGAMTLDRPQEDATEDERGAPPLEGLARWHNDYPAERDPPPDGVFEIGLCMAGAVSAGAYTAGVLDFMVEALDAFERERGRRRAAGEAPLHQVRLPVLGGASAGGMCAAIASVFLDAEFPPARMGMPEEERERNPLYRAWVSRIDIRPMLGDRDVHGGKELASLLDCTVLDEIVDDLLDLRADPRRTRAAHRPWLATPLRAVLTLSNLRGVPYALRFGDNSKLCHWMSHHADHVRFAVPLDPAAGAVEPPLDGIKVGETVLDRRAGPESPERKAFKAVALGTGGFPVALAPRVLERPVADYLYRAALTPTGLLKDLKEEDAKHPGPAWAARVAPVWEEPEPNPYSALCVDGGAMNNEPLDLVRRVLAGYAGTSPRQAKDAVRAVVLIDPFVNPPNPGPDRAKGLVGSVLPLFKALVQNSRFKPEDVAMAADPAIGSRFLVAPSRGRAWQGRGAAGTRDAEGAIAGGHFGGFMGFFDKAYREHDFFLGRRNAQKFLRDVFVLPEGEEGNNLFKSGRWSDADKEKWAAWPLGPGGGRHLPVIPLCGGLRERIEPLPPWPAGRFDAAAIRALVDRRAKVVMPAVRDALIGPVLAKGRVRPFMIKTGVWALGALAKPRVVDAIMETLAKEAEKLDSKAG